MGGWQRLFELAEQAAQPASSLIITLKPRELQLMIGATRQILLWKRKHFKAFGQFVDAYQLDTAPFLLVHSQDMPRKRLKQAEKEQLKAIPARSEQAKHIVKQGIVLDRIQKGGSKDYQVVKRMAAIMTRNQSSSVHGSYEWITLFIAWAVAMRRA